MLVFASAGIDSMVKQLVADALPLAVTADPEARGQFRSYVERRLKAPDSARLLADAFAADNSREHLTLALVSDLRSGSLQSVDELARAAAFFAIPVADFIGDVDALRRAFRVRNEISHEMDVDFSVAPSIRRQRQLAEMEDYASSILAAAVKLLHRVSERLLHAQGTAVN
jgi:hypothetical protein